MDRRSFLSTLASAAVASRAVAKEPTARSIPRWRGFNLQGFFTPPGRPYEEFDFASMAEWGFDFARLPLSYWVWGSRDDWSRIREEPLVEIDRAIELGRRYGVHVNLNFHRLPGYCINGRDQEPMDLFAGTPAERATALEAATRHWQAFARRYKGVPNSRLSFDLINEPPRMASEDRYVEVVRALVAGIRAVDPGRLIFADGIDIGQTPVFGIVDLGLVQSTRGYLPKAVSHYTATWVPKDEFESFAPPTWPLKDDKAQTWDRARLRREYVEKYRPLVAKGVRVHVGEWGVFNKTPHAVALAWMRDSLAVWKEAGWGNALWELRGSFGVLDSGRADVAYEDFKGHKLDRKMLELLRHA
jgi:endoglucanase